MSWNDERVDLMSRLWLDGRSASQIANELGHGVTRNAVIGKLHRLGLSNRTRPASAPAAQPTRLRLKPVPADAADAGLEAALPVPTATAVAVQSLVPAQRRTGDVVIPLTGRVTIMELREAMCRWPLGDPSSAEFRYCGCRSTVGPYCREHAALAFQPTQERRRVERLARIA